MESSLSHTHSHLHSRRSSNEAMQGTRSSRQSQKVRKTTTHREMILSRTLSCLIVVLGVLVKLTNAWYNHPTSTSFHLRVPIRLRRQFKQQTLPLDAEILVDNVSLDDCDILSQQELLYQTVQKFDPTAASTRPHDSNTFIDDIMALVKKQSPPSVNTLRAALWIVTSKSTRVQEATWLFRQIDIQQAVTVVDMERILTSYCSKNHNSNYVGAAFYAETLLRHWEVQSQPQLQPVAKMYRTVLKALTLVPSSSEAQNRAVSILHTMEERFANTGDPLMQPTYHDYSDVVTAWTMLTPPLKTYLDHATQLLQNMTASLRLHSPDEILRSPFYDVIHAYRSCSNMTTFDKAMAADQLFVHFMMQYELGKYPLEVPNGTHFVAVLRSWALCFQVPRAIKLFDTVKKMVDKGILKAKDMYTLEVIRRIVSTLRNAESKGFGDTVKEMIDQVDFSQYSSIEDKQFAEKTVLATVEYLCLEETKENVMKAYDILDRLRNDECGGKHVFNEVQCLRLISGMVNIGWQGCGNDVMNVIDMLEETVPNPTNLTRRAVGYSMAVNALRRYPAIDSSYQADRLLSLVVNKLGKNLTTGSFEYNPIEILSIHIKSQDPESHHRAMQTFFLMDDADENGTCGGKRVKDSLWNEVLKKVLVKEGGYIAAMSILQRMQQKDSSGKPKAQLTNAIFGSVMKAWMLSDAPSRMENMELLYETMKERHAAGDMLVKPNILHLNMILTAYASIGSVEASRRVVELFQDASTRLKQGDLSFIPRPETTKALADSLISADHQTLDSATEILMNIGFIAFMTDDFMKVADVLIENGKGHNATTLITRLRNRGLGDRTQISQLLSRAGASAEKPSDSSKLPEPAPTTAREDANRIDEIWSVIDVLVSSKNADDLAMADFILLEAERSYNENNDAPRPSLEVYKRIIDAFSHIGCNEKEMELTARKNSMYGVQKSVNGAHEIADTKEGITQICTNAMDTLSGADSVEINQIADVLEPVDLGVHNKESAVHDLRGLILADDSVEINQIADELEPVDLEVHNEESAVHDLLGLIIAELGGEYTVVNAESFSKALGLVIQKKPLPFFTTLHMIQLAATVESTPLHVSDFDLIMNAYKNSGSTEAVEYGWSVFMVMDQLAEQGRDDLRVSRAQFDDMMMWARTKGVPSVEMQVLLMMEERFLGGRSDLEPVSPLYNQCLFVLAQQGASGQAQVLLRHMIQSPVVHADLTSFFYVMNALSQVPNQADSAWSVVRLMVDAGINPDTRCLNQVLKACRKSDEYYEVAVAIVKIFHKQSLPDSYSMSQLLDLVFQLSDIVERKRLAVKVVGLCRKKGLMSFTFLETLLNDETMTRQTLGDYYVGDVDDVWAKVPRHWSINT